MVERTVENMITSSILLALATFLEIYRHSHLFNQNIMSVQFKTNDSL